MRTFLISLFILASFISFGQGKILFIQDNEGTTKWSWEDLCCTYSSTKDSTHGVAGGKYSNKILLNKSDPLVSGNHRAEHLWNSNAWQTPSNTQVAWVAASITLDASWVVDPNRPEGIINIHDGEPCANRATNPAGLWVNGDHYEFVINSSQTDYCSGGYNNIVRVATLQLGKIVPGQKEDWIIHFKNSTTSGYDSVWRNGVLVGSYRGPNWYVGIFAEPYIKFGIYKWSWNFTDQQAGGPSTTQQRILYQDNIKVGDTSCRLSTFLGTVTPPPVNKPPIANAGPDQILPPGVLTATLRGNGTDTDGTIVSYSWRTFQTPTGWYGTSNLQNWTITGYMPSKITYGYELTVTDNKGAIGKDTMYITVPIINTAPVIAPIAGVNVTIPVAFFILTATATDAEGDPVTFIWTRPDGTFSAGASITDTIKVAGTYVYTVTATDAKGLSSTKTATVMVNPIPPKLVIRVEAFINPKTGGFITILHYADGTQSDPIE